MGIANTAPLATAFDRKSRIARNSSLLFDAGSTQYLQSKTNLVINTDDTMLVAFNIDLLDVVSDYLFEYGLYGALIDSNGFLFIWTKDTITQTGFTTIDLSDFINRTAHIAIAFDELNDHVRIYINGVLVFTKDLVPSSGVIVNGNDVVEIGRWQGTAPTGYSNNAISEFIICEYNQADFTEPAQVAYLFIEGIPSTVLHGFIFAHYPINEDLAFKADAAFVAVHGSFSVGDNVFFDVVEQYNYAKSSGVTAKHTKAIAFTDVQIGTAADSSYGSIRDFYSKTQNYNVGFNAGLSANLDSIIYEYRSNGNLGDATVGTLPDNSSFTFAWIGAVSSGITRSEVGAGEVMAQFETQNLEMSLRTSTILRLRLGGAVAGDFNLPFNFTTANQDRPMIVIVRFDTATLDVKWWLRFLDAPNAITSTAVSPSNWTRPNNAKAVIATGSLNHLRFIASEAKESDAVITAMLNLDFSTMASTFMDWIFQKKISLTLEDTVGTLNADLFRRTATSGVVGDVADVARPVDLEVFSGFQPAIQSFNIDNSFSIDTPTTVGDAVDDNDLTVLITLKFPSGTMAQAADRPLIQWPSHVTATKLMILIAGIVRSQNAGNSDIFTATNIETQIINVFIQNVLSVGSVTQNKVFVDNHLFATQQNSVTFDLTGDFLQVKGPDQDTDIIRFAAWSRLLSEREMLNYTKNMIIGHPVLVDQDALECYYLMNKKLFWEDGSNVLLTDLSLNKRDAKVFGLTGGTTALQLADVPNHLNVINSLR